MSSSHLLQDTTCYHIAGTKFLRLASRKQFGYGSNHQNKPDDLRSIYVPHSWNGELRRHYIEFLASGDLGVFAGHDTSKIYCFLQCDQAGAEALIVSKLLRPGNKLDALFRNKIKPHTYLGCFFPHIWIDKGYPQVDEIRMLPIDKVREHSGWAALAAAINSSDYAIPPEVRHYYLYKQTCHSGNYGIKAPTFILNILEKSGGKVVLSKAQGEMFLNAYHTMLPELQEWWRETEEQVRTNGGIIWNMLGYPIHFTQEIKEGDLKDVYAACPQSTVGCITHKCIIGFNNYIWRNNLRWNICNNNHDSCLLECPISDVRHAASVLKEQMEQTLISPRGEKFNMRSEVQIGFNWGKAKKIPEGTDITNIVNIEKYNIDGLREVKWLMAA